MSLLYVTTIPWHIHVATRKSHPSTCYDLTLWHLSKSKNNMVQIVYIQYLGLYRCFTATKSILSRPIHHNREAEFIINIINSSVLYFLLVPVITDSISSVAVVRVPELSPSAPGANDICVPTSMVDVSWCDFLVLTIWTVSEMEYSFDIMKITRTG